MLKLVKYKFFNMMKPKEKKTCIIARNINKSDIYSIKKVKETN